MKIIQNKSIVLVDQHSFMTPDILTQYKAGKFRHIVKTKLGFTVCESREFDNTRMMQYPESIISSYKKGVLHTVEFCPEGHAHYQHVFCRVGTKVKLIDESILANLTVATINSLYINTNLYSHTQYTAVGAKTWADKAYVENAIEEAVAA